VTGGKLVQDTKDVEAKLTKEVLSFCNHIVHPCEIVAACKRNDFAPILPATKRISQILIIVRNFQSKLMNLAKAFDGANLSILVVDTWVFERDVDRGFLGEALAGALIFPYTALENPDYLHSQEVILKKRLITELLQSLVLDFPELSYELHMKPEYFMYEAMLTRGRLFPPTLYAFANLTRNHGGQGNMAHVLDGFVEALKQLEKTGVVYYANGYWKISKQFADKSKSLRYRFIDLFKTGQRAVFTASLGIFPQILEALSQNPEGLLKTQLSIDDLVIKEVLEDPEDFVYLPTATGLVPLSNRMDIKAFARKALGADKDARIKIKSVGGILNDVYLVETSTKGRQAKAIIKQFRDWSNFKWFPLTLWSVGTRSFAVAGSSRLERECAMNRFLDSKGFAVPRLLNVSPNQRLVVMEYVEGEDLTQIVRRSTNSKSAEQTRDALMIVEKVGQTLARVHSLDVALGDTKPENIFVDKKGDIYLMDFEQSSRKGDIVWDVAEFLFYAGHDISPFTDAKRLKRFAETFIKGYLEAGGQAATVKSAGTAKYTKVFSIFTYPHIVYALSNACRNANKREV
jgi:tRNA A-37 threonylcarbamoyl transferase component Bud32